MAWETGTASSQDDLMDKLLLFLTTDSTLVAASQEWTVLSDTTDTDRLVYLEGQGLSATDEIFVNINQYFWDATGAYNWDIRGTTGYDSGFSRDLQPGTSDSIYFCLSNLSGMTYWFVANGRRFIVIVKIGTVYVSLYAGFLYPYATPSEYPYPLCIGASTTTESKIYTDNTSRF